MLTVGDKLPSLKLAVQQGTSALPAGETIDLGETDGKWKVLFYWPKDFTFVCPTEIVGYGELKQDFEDRDAMKGTSADGSATIAGRMADAPPVAWLGFAQRCTAHKGPVSAHAPLSGI